MPRNNLKSAHNLKAEEKKQRAVAMKKAGHSVNEIAKALGVVPRTVHGYIANNTAASINRRLEDGQQIFEEQLMKLDQIEFDAEQQFKRSCRDRKRITKVTGESTEKDAIDEKTTEMTEGQAGDPRYLQIRLAVIKQRCDLLGLNAPVKISGELNTNTNVNVQVGITVQALESMSNDELLEYLDETRSTLVSGPSSEAGTDSPSVVPQLPPQETTDIPPRDGA